jgi:guanine nucleotide-binding protein G(I)/G(S)/G(T) subunit beta-1
MTTFQQLLDKATDDIEEFQRQILARVEQSETPVLPSLAQERRIPGVEIKLTSKRTLRGHFGKIYAMHWSPSSPQILGSAAPDGKLLVWNAYSMA